MVAGMERGNGNLGGTVAPILMMVERMKRENGS